MPQDPPLVYKDFAAGQVNNVNPSLTPQNAVELGLNLVFDEEIGSAASRLGTSIVGAQLVDNVSVLGLFQHVDQADTTKNKLFATVNDGTSPANADIYDVIAGTKSLQDDTASLKTYFLNYAGDTLRLNGTDAPKAYNSSSWITTGGVFDLGNMPTGYKYAKEFLSRVYLWGKAGYTLAYSGVLTAGAVSWTSGNGTVEVEPEDNGGEPTGLGKVPGYILIFKRRSMHRWNFSSAFPEELVNIGAYSQESIVEAGGLCAFYSDSNENDRGFFITNGGRPQPISHGTNRPIKKWVDAISSTANIAGYATNSGFAWSVGDLTVDGESFVNVHLAYNRILNQWSVFSYPTEHKIFAHYVVSGVHTVVAGDDDGTVYRINKSGTYSDNGTSIRYKLRTVHRNFGTNRLKTLTDNVAVKGRNLQGATLSVIPDENVEGAVSMGAPPFLRRILSYFGVRKQVRGTTLSFEVSGETSAARAFIQEIEVAKPSVDQSYV